MLNGLFSLTKYGLDACYNGFGLQEWRGGCRFEGDDERSWGRLDFTPEDSSDSGKVVDELATLLTSGRLNEESRNIIKHEYETAEDTDMGLRLAQQLITVSPEFHSTNLMEFNGEPIPEPEPVDPPSHPYKAVIFLNLDGGSDSYNFLIPHSQCSSTDMYAEYVEQRGSIAKPKHLLHQIGTGGQPQVCDRFGIHPDLPTLKALYDDNDLSFFSNVGVLFEYVNKDDWQFKTQTQLFAHNVQQREIQVVDPFNKIFGTGVLGRMADVSTANGYITGSFSIADQQQALNGEPQKSPSVYTLSPDGIQEFNEMPSTENMRDVIFNINNVTTTMSGVFGKTWSKMVEDFIRQYEDLSEALDGVSFSDQYPNSWLGRQLATVSSVMQMRSAFNQDRQFFYVESLRWDTHLDQPSSESTLFPDLNDCLNAFVDVTKTQEIWDDVVVVVTSEFGRTFVANSGAGTDHGWGGECLIVE